MTGNFIDSIRYSWKQVPKLDQDFFYLDTDYGKIRVFDTKGNLPVIINVPDGPNVIEHQLPLLESLSKDFRVVSFEYPGVGYSFPNRKYDYSYESGAGLLFQIMDIMKLVKVNLLFSCSNGFYAMHASANDPDRFNHIFLSQTPSFESMLQWTKKSIPSLLKIPIVGQLTNAIYDKKLADTWYKYALPKDHPHRKKYRQIAKSSLSNGGCFCLSSLVHGLKKEEKINVEQVVTPTTMVWGSLDFTHRNTDKHSIKKHIKHCEIIEFNNCGHFPELERTQEYVRLIKERIS